MIDGREESRLERLLTQGVFAITAEVVPPRSADPLPVTTQARELAGYADALNVTDNPTSSAHMSPLAACSLVAAAGMEPVLQVTCRDRNRLGLTSDLLGAWALGARSILCLTGDPPGSGDHPEAKPVFDLGVHELVALAAALRREGRLLSGAVVHPAPRYFVGVADVPLAEGYSFDPLERKADAGASFVQTQIVFDVEAFEKWAAMARSRGILQRLRVLPGVAVPASARAARFMRDHLRGVRVPEAVIERLEEAGPEAEDEGVRLGVEIVARLKAIEGVAGVHLIGLGRMRPLRRLIEAAGLSPRPVE